MTAAMTADMTLDCFDNQVHDSSDSRQSTLSCVRVRVYVLIMCCHMCHMCHTYIISNKKQKVS